jgi:DNA-binding MarR family transcriptional regulator
MSVHVMVAIFDADGLTPTEKLVALAYAEHGHDDGREARAGIERICGYTALSRRTVQTTLQSLVAKKVIEVERPSTNKRPTCYRFILSPDGKSLARGAVVAPQDDAGGATDTAGGATDDTLGCNSRTQTVSEPSDEPTPSSKVFDDEVISLTTLLADLIEQNGSKRPTVTDKWRNEIRLLRDKDNHSCRQIENMIRWCQADSFWRANILSATKLRAKYDQMRLRALAEDPRTKELEHQEASSMPAEDDWEEELERRRQESAPPPTNFAETIRKQMNGDTHDNGQPPLNGQG